MMTIITTKTGFYVQYSRNGAEIAVFATVCWFCKPKLTTALFTEAFWITLLVENHCFFGINIFIYKSSDYIWLSARISHVKSCELPQYWILKRRERERENPSTTIFHPSLEKQLVLLYITPPPPPYSVNFGLHFLCLCSLPHPLNFPLFGMAEFSLGVPTTFCQSLGVTSEVTTKIL